jgi:hypothetical protein
VSRRPNYTPKEAVKEENLVKIALWNGKIFHAGVVDVFDNGGKLHIVRLNKGRVVRREVLAIDYGPGNIREVCPLDGHILRGISSDHVLSVNKENIFKKYKKMESVKNTQGISKNVPSGEFLNFVKEQERFFARRELDSRIMNQKIQCAERRSGCNVR